uniref:COesterase domain-containing protein n=1 Tax=Ascaris lumbricoides TaxID=6252 RepID=A0A0M3IE52_ASCLU
MNVMFFSMLLSIISLHGPVVVSIPSPRFIPLEPSRIYSSELKPSSSMMRRAHIFTQPGIPGVSYEPIGPPQIFYRRILRPVYVGPPISVEYFKRLPSVNAQIVTEDINVCMNVSVFFFLCFNSISIENSITNLANLFVMKRITNSYRHLNMAKNSLVFTPIESNK